MRFILAAVSLVVSLALFGVGIFQIVAARAEDHITAAGATSTGAPLIVIPSETLVTHAGAQQIDIEGDGPVIAVVGRQGDVAAWVGTTVHDLAQIDPETGQMVFTPGEGSDPSAPNPAGSDLWYAEYTGEGTLEVDASLPPGFAVLIASTGDTPAPGQLSITWPLDGRAPWSGPLLIAGAVFLLIALGLGLWGLIELRRGIKPRRKSNGSSGAPIPLAPGANAEPADAESTSNGAEGDDATAWPPPTLEPTFSGPSQDATPLPSPWSADEAERTDAAPNTTRIDTDTAAGVPSFESSSHDEAPSFEAPSYEAPSYGVAPEAPGWDGSAGETTVPDVAPAELPSETTGTNSWEPNGVGAASGSTPWEVPAGQDTGAPTHEAWDAPADAHAAHGAWNAHADAGGTGDAWDADTPPAADGTFEHHGAHRGAEPWEPAAGVDGAVAPDEAHHGEHRHAEPWEQGAEATDQSGRDGTTDEHRGDDDRGGPSDPPDAGPSDSGDSDPDGSGGSSAGGAAPDESSKWRRPRGRDRAAAPKRLFRIAPVFLVGTLFLTGCSSITMWPEALGGPPENPTATPTSSIDAALAEEGAPLPALSDTQLTEILADTATVAEAADAAGDATQLAARFAGAALTERTATYKTRAADAAAAPDPFPTGNVVYTVPEATDSWPRTVFTVVESATAGEAPFGIMLVQEQPRDAYKVHSLTRLVANVSLPDAPPAAIGAPGLAALAPNLAVAPDQLAAAYGSIILQGDASPSAALFSAETDPLREQIGQAYRDGKLGAIDQATSRFEFSNRPGPDAPVGVGTLDGGAIVAVSMEEVERFSARSQLATLSVTGRTAALAGVTQSPNGFESVFTDQLLFYVPPTSAGAPVQFLGYSQTMTSARQLDASEVTFG